MDQPPEAVLSLPPLLTPSIGWPSLWLCKLAEAGRYKPCPQCQARVACRSWTTDGGGNGVKVVESRVGGNGLSVLAVRTDKEQNSLCFL